MSKSKQFVVEELEILNEENKWKGEYWWAVVNTKRVEDCFECRNKEVALRLCDLLNRQTKIISAYKYEFAKLQMEKNKLKEENKQLKQKIENYYTVELIDGKFFINLSDLLGE